jgi:hypothetical protein
LPTDDTAICNFCGKSQGEVLRIVAGPNKVFICDQCAILAFQIVCLEGGPAYLRLAYFAFNLTANVGAALSRLFSRSN